MADLPPSLLRQEIENESRRLGFQLFGVTTPEPPQNFALFENWLNAGRHAGMAYLSSDRSRQRRADPGLILPGCQSILVFGIRYAASDREVPGKPPATEPVGKSAAYAWGEDYHEIIPDRLAQLIAHIESLVGRRIQSKIYTDSGPLLERELAQRAGLGWIGKNSCLVHPHHGSFFLLGEVLLDLFIEADPPFTKDYCGSCRRCLDACPTGCILPNRTIDSSHCISYLTIENKGAIPASLRPLLDGWIFGCDICQQVCPWNRHSLHTPGDPAFMTRMEHARPALIPQLSLSAQEFNQQTRGTPLQRAKRRGLLRNAANAIGCARDAQAVPVLSRAIGDLEPLVRIHSAWALGQIGGEDALKALEDALQSENDPVVQAEILSAMRGCQETRPDEKYDQNAVI